MLINEQFKLIPGSIIKRESLFFGCVRDSVPFVASTLKQMSEHCSTAKILNICAAGLSLVIVSRAFVVARFIL